MCSLFSNVDVSKKIMVYCNYTILTQYNKIHPNSLDLVFWINRLNNLLPFEVTPRLDVNYPLACVQLEHPTMRKIKDITLLLETAWSLNCYEIIRLLLNHVKIDNLTLRLNKHYIEGTSQGQTLYKSTKLLMEDNRITLHKQTRSDLVYVCDEKSVLLLQHKDMDIATLGLFRLTKPLSARTVIELEDKGIINREGYAMNFYWSLYPCDKIRYLYKAFEGVFTRKTRIISFDSLTVCTYLYFVLLTIQTNFDQNLIAVGLGTSWGIPALYILFSKIWDLVNLIKRYFNILL